MKYSKMVTLYAIVVTLFVTEFNSFAEIRHKELKVPDLGVKQTQIIPECYGVAIEKTIWLKVEIDDPGVEVKWTTSGTTHGARIEPTFAHKVNLFAGRESQRVHITACALGSDSICGVEYIEIYDCKKCNSGSVMNKQDGTLSTEPPAQCCVKGEKIQKNPIPEGKKLEDCPDRVDNRKMGKEHDGCSVPGWLPKFLVGGNVNNPMGDPTGCARFDTDGCDNHDECYGTCRKYRLECETEFREDLNSICNKYYEKVNEPDDYDEYDEYEPYDQCIFYAKSYSGATRIFAGGAWEERQMRGCNCCRDEPAR